MNTGDLQSDAGTNFDSTITVLEENGETIFQTDQDLPEATVTPEKRKGHNSLILLILFVLGVRYVWKKYIKR